MIQNPVFFVYNVIMSSIVYAIGLVTGDPKSRFEKEPTINSRTRHVFTIMGWGHTYVIYWEDPAEGSAFTKHYYRFRRRANARNVSFKILDDG